MKWFARKARDDEDTLADGDDTPDDPTIDERGPWDVEQVPEIGKRTDFGALRVPERAGMDVRVELERSTRRLVAVALRLDNSSLQVQAFAAPRSAGLWEELREEIAASVAKQGGSATEQDGPFGVELLARLPVRTADGRSASRPARFVGIDGPRWFVRGVLTGPAVSDPEAAAGLEAVLADIVVVRGHEARAPRDLLALHMPGKPGQDGTQGGTTARPSIDLGSPRGPEITEVR